MPALSTEQSSLQCGPPRPLLQALGPDRQVGVGLPPARSPSRTAGPSEVLAPWSQCPFQVGWTQLPVGIFLPPAHQVKGGYGSGWAGSTYTNSVPLINPQSLCPAGPLATSTKRLSVQLPGQRGWKDSVGHVQERWWPGQQGADSPRARTQRSMGWGQGHGCLPAPTSQRGAWWWRASFTPQSTPTLVRTPRAETGSGRFSSAPVFLSTHVHSPSLF